MTETCFDMTDENQKNKCLFFHALVSSVKKHDSAKCISVADLHSLNSTHPNVLAAEEDLLQSTRPTVRVLTTTKSCNDSINDIPDRNQSDQEKTFVHLFLVVAPLLAHPYSLYTKVVE